jgi:ABC-type antimicrobial peptide transport system permease subunit
MNYIKHLTGFFDRIIPDRNLNPTHISLYIALFQSWNINRFQNPISISRDEVMRICKISSKATYHKCMRDLNDKGYVKYEPSFNPYKGSIVFLFDFSDYLKPVQKRASTNEKNLSKMEQVLNEQQTSTDTSTGTSTEQALVSSINNTNITNNSNIENLENLGEQTQNFQNEDDFLKNEGSEEKEKSSAKKEKESVPTNEEVKTYFLEQNFPEREANKFFNYFSSVGWLVGGKTPMVDWKAAAKNWMLNAPSFISHEKTPDRAKHLNTGTDKDYSEPF